MGMDRLHYEVRCIHDPVTNILYTSISDVIDLIKETADHLSARGLQGEAAGVAGLGLGLLNSYEAYFQNPVNQMVVKFFENQN